MSIVLRALVMLAAVMPLFVAKSFHPAWWQTLLAAAIGSALGQVADRATRGRRRAAWAVAIIAAVTAALPVAWLLSRTARHDDRSANRFLVVRSADRQTSLTWDDVHAIATQIPAIQLAVPYLHGASQLVSEDQNWNTQLVGTTPDYFALRDLHFAAGHPFDASGSGKVVVLGDTVVTQLYGAGRLPIGDTVRIQSMPYTIIGVLAHAGMTTQGQDLDDVAIMPIELYRSRIAFAGPSRFGGVVLISAATPGETERVSTEVRALLRDRHRLAPGADDDFVIRDVPALQ